MIALPKENLDSHQEIILPEQYLFVNNRKSEAEKTLNLFQKNSKDKLTYDINDSESSKNDESYVIQELIGLEKRIAMQHRLVSSEKKIENDIISLSEELQDYIIPISKPKYESIDNFSDNHPCLDFRKSILRIKIFVSELSYSIVSNSRFDSLIIIVIILNLVFLAIESPNYPSSLAFVQFELSFTIIYTLECIMKIAAYGFVLSPGAYLRDWWNIIDFMIVITSLIGLFGESSLKLSSLRVIRILRPLRGISSIEGMRVLILSLAMAFKPLINALIVLGIVISLFAIVGLQLWSGVLRTRCLSLDTGLLEANCGYDNCGISQICSNTITNPLYNSLSFDSFFYAWLVVFQVITLEGWSQILLYVSKAFSLMSLLYFIPLVVVGSMLFLNLTVAVVTASFTTALVNYDLAKKRRLKNSLNSLIHKYRDLSLRKTIQPYDILHYDNYDEEEDIQLNDTINKNGLVPWPESAIDTENGKTDRSLNRTALTVENYPFAATLVWRNSEKYQKEISRSFEYARAFSIRVNNNKQNQKLVVSEKHRLEYGSYKALKVIEIRSLQGLKDTILESEYKIIEKYKKKFQGIAEMQLFLYFKRISGGKNAFFKLKINVKAIIKEFSNENFPGEWSGDEVNQYFIERSHELRASLISMNYQLENPIYRFCLLLSLACENISGSKKFNILMSAIVFVNIVVLSSYFYGISSQAFQALTQINNTCTIIFFIEFLIKILGQGIKKYIRDNMNALDFLTTVLSIIEFFFAQSAGFNALRMLRILRLFRILKIIRIFRYMKSFFQLIKIISRSISKFMYLLLLMLLFQVIFTLIGMQIFGNQFRFAEGLPQNNFDTFQDAFITVFQILSTENWDKILTFCMRSDAGHWSSIYLIIWIILGNFIMLNLFLGILLGDFESDSEYEDSKSIIINKDEIFTNLVTRAKKKKAIREQLIKDYNEDSKSDFDYYFESIKNFTIQDTHKTESPDLAGTSFIFLTLENNVRRFFLRIILSNKFEIFIIFLIVSNVIKLVWDTYYVSDSNDSIEAEVSKNLDFMFTSIFAIEFVFKSIGLGLAFEKHTYLQDNWNKLDFIILILSIIDSALSTVNIRIIRVFRVLRILRPLKLIRYNISMKIVIKALIESLIASINVILIISIVSLTFAILGVGLFNGKLYHCENPTIITMQNCELQGFNWQASAFNYDNVLEALITLFTISSQEAWPDRMFEGINAVDVEVAPIINYNPAASYFFIIYVFIGDFFLMNLFTIVIYSKFTEAKKHESSITSILLTKNQMNWIEIQNLVIKSKPISSYIDKDQSIVKKISGRIVSSVPFKLFLTSIIIINTIQMAMMYEGSSSAYNVSLNVINEICTVAFILEACLKILAQGVKGYFLSTWNRFDFFVVATSIIFWILEQVVLNNVSILRFGPQLLRIFRVAKLSRVFKVFESLNYLMDLLNVIMFSLPAALNVLTMMLLILLIYAILGVYLFGHIRGSYLNSNWNFSNFHMAVLLLWRLSTGEDYPYIMNECAKYYDSKFVCLYFISFVTITTFILMEFFVSVIIQNYREFVEDPNSAVHIFNTVIRRFKNIWLDFSKDQNGVRVHSDQIYKLLLSLGPEIGISKEFKEKDIKMLIYSMRISIDSNGFIYYHDLLYALMRRRYSKNSSRGSESYINKIMAEKEAHIYKRLKTIRDAQRVKIVSEKNSGIQNYNKLLVDFSYYKNFFSAWKTYSIKRIRARKVQKCKPEYH